jgi:hypothetical protein
MLPWDDTREREGAVDGVLGASSGRKQRGNVDRRGIGTSIAAEVDHANQFFFDVDVCTDGTRDGRSSGVRQQ